MDEVSHFLENSGAVGYMVEIGGEVKTYGRKGDGEPWRIAVEKPLNDSRDVALILETG